MKHVISIDWLALFCKIPTGSFTDSVGGRNKLDFYFPWDIKREDNGTRQFRELHRVSLNGEEMYEVQSAPYSTILKADSCIIRVVNRQLYTIDFWYRLQRFMEEFGIIAVSLSRCDLCADFNCFKSYKCIPFIKDFLSGVIRHKGRGKGAAYFDHRSKVKNGISKAVVKYSGLSFGSNESDVRAYLYNKTFELNTVKNKPYIRELWRRAGLDVTRDVWRLEISIKSGGRKFKDRMTGAKIEVSPGMLENETEMGKIYHTFVNKYWAFVKNRRNITNITREPLLQLFDLTEIYIHRGINNQSCSSRTERILIRQLWQMAETYRGDGLTADEGVTKSLAVDLAKNTGLTDWLKKKGRTWDKPSRK